MKKDHSFHYDIMGYRLIFLLGLMLLFFPPRLSSENYLTGPFLHEKMSGSPVFSSPLARAYLTGDKSGLSRKKINMHKDLGIMHLMTPSGLHLAALFFIVSLVIKNTLSRFILCLGLLILLHHVPGVDSFKRMCLFGLLRYNPVIKINSLFAFFLTFLCYYLGGQYHAAPLSFSLSFLFLSILLLAKHRLEIFLSLLFLQYILALYFTRAFYPLGAIYGFTLSLLAPILLPLSFLDNYFTHISLYWWQLLTWLHSFKGPQLSFPILFLAVFFFFHHNKKTRNLLAALFLMIPNSIFSPSKKYYQTSPPAPGYTHRTLKGNKMTFFYDNGMKCKASLKQDYWQTRCYK